MSEYNFSQFLCNGGRVTRIFDSSTSVVLYSFLVSALYVSSLYILVPKPVRNLERNHTTHVKWRSLATSIVSAFSWYTFPFFFCQSGDNGLHRRFDLVTIVNHSFQVLMHTASLFFGTVVYAPSPNSPRY